MAAGTEISRSFSFAADRDDADDRRRLGDVGGRSAARWGAAMLCISCRSTALVVWWMPVMTKGA